MKNQWLDIEPGLHRPTVVHAIIAFLFRRPTADSARLEEMMFVLNTSLMGEAEIFTSTMVDTEFNFDERLYGTGRKGK